MILSLRDVPIDGPTEFTLSSLGDIHQGAGGCHKTLLRRALKSIERDKNRFWICTGDMLDADRPSMRDRKLVMYAERERAEAFTQEDKRNLAWLDRDVLPMYAPVAKKCLGILDGDHYLVFSNGMSSGKYIARRLGIPYLGERMGYAGLRFRYGKSTRLYAICARHGKGASGSNGADVNALEKQNAQFIADLYLGGHTHKENCHPVPLLYPNKNFTEMSQKIIWYVRGGSFLRGYLPGKATYAELAEYGPLATGWAEVSMRVHRMNHDDGVLRCDAWKASLVAM